MPDEQHGGKILGMPRRMALYVIGGAVVLVVAVLALRGRGQAAGTGVAQGVGGADALGALPGGGSAGAAYNQMSADEVNRQAQLAQLGFESQKQEIALGQQQMAFQSQQVAYEQERIVAAGKRANAAEAEYQAKFEAVSKGQKLQAGQPGHAIKCQSGVVHADVETGQLYCRTKEGKSFFKIVGDAINEVVEGAGRGAGQAAETYVGSYGGAVPQVNNYPRSHTSKKPYRGTYGTPPIMEA